MARLALTMRRIEAAVCPPDRTELKLWDSTQPGLVLRVRRSGSKIFAIRYRPAGGRHAPLRTLTLGDAETLTLAEARRLARLKLLEVATGGDPAAVKAEVAAEAQRRVRSALSAALDAYEVDLARRNVVKRVDMLRLLRRELLGELGDVDLRELDRATLVARIREVEASGRPGAAQDLRAKGAVFLNWAVNEGLMQASPLAGYRRPRLSRSQRLVRPGRALADDEIPAIWRACDACEDPMFAAYLRTLLLTGQRRMETVLMRWADLDLDARIWLIPPEVTKVGRTHRVPLPAEAMALLDSLPRMAELVFPGRGGRPISGFSKRLSKVEAATVAAGLRRWTPHDLRRTYRTGLGRLGVAPHVADLLVNHQLSDDLTARYDRGAYWPERVEAAALWARHVLALVEGGSDARQAA